MCVAKINIICKLLLWWITQNRTNRCDLLKKKKKNEPLAMAVERLLPTIALFTLENARNNSTSHNISTIWLAAWRLEPLCLQWDGTACTLNGSASNLTNKNLAPLGHIIGQTYLNHTDILAN